MTGGRPFTCLITSDAELQRAEPRISQERLRHRRAVFSVVGRRLGSWATLRSRSSTRGARQRSTATPVGSEIEILMLHGVLHLLGMDHEKDRGRMARAENKWRAAFGLPRGLIGRVRP